MCHISNVCGNFEKNSRGTELKKVKLSVTAERLPLECSQAVSWRAVGVACWQTDCSITHETLEFTQVFQTSTTKTAHT
jgi:hypothetical protein